MIHESQVELLNNSSQHFGKVPCIGKTHYRKSVRKLTRKGISWSLFESLLRYRFCARILISILNSNFCVMFRSVDSFDYNFIILCLYQTPLSLGLKESKKKNCIHKANIGFFLTIALYKSDRTIYAL